MLCHVHDENVKWHAFRIVWTRPAKEHTLIDEESSFVVGALLSLLLSSNIKQLSGLKSETG